MVHLFEDKQHYVGERVPWIGVSITSQGYRRWISWQCCTRQNRCKRRSVYLINKGKVVSYMSASYALT